MKNVLYYKYMELSDLDEFRESHFELCKSLNLLGKVLIAKEGINGCMTGEFNDIQKYINKMREDKRFTDIDFKITDSPKGHGFKKLFVRIRQEIVTSKMDIDLNKKGKYIEPKKLKEMYDNGEDFVIMDMRNMYEAKIGKFRNAIVFDTDIFRDVIKHVKEIEHLKNKKIITYCTGGVRCEKASALLVENGFKDVNQLHGGIIKYGLECSNNYWEGKCFVFDTRGAIEIDPSKQSEIIAQCELCNIPSDVYHNCKRFACDKRFISCENCLSILGECCSKNCRNIEAKNSLVN